MTISEPSEPETRVYIVETWDITLRSGHTASFALRADMGDTLTIEGGWWVLRFPRIKREARICEGDIAATNHALTEIKQTVKFKPTKRDNVEKDTHVHE